MKSNSTNMEYCQGIVLNQKKEIPEWYIKYDPICENKHKNHSFSGFMHTYVNTKKNVWKVHSKPLTHYL